MRSRSPISCSQMTTWQRGMLPPHARGSHKDATLQQLREHMNVCQLEAAQGLHRQGSCHRGEFAKTAGSFFLVPALDHLLAAPPVAEHPPPAWE